MKFLSVLVLSVLCVPQIVFGLSLNAPTETKSTLLSSLSSSADLKTSYNQESINDEQTTVGLPSSPGINQRPQVQPVMSPSSNKGGNTLQQKPQIFPAVQPAPPQLPLDVLPPLDLDEDIMIGSDDPAVKSKRQSSNSDRQAKFFIPSISWGGWGNNNNNNNAQKPGSCYRPDSNNNYYGNTNYPGSGTGTGGNYYYTNSRVKRQAVAYTNGGAQPYYTNGNNGGFGSWGSSGSNGGGSGGNNYYPGSGNNGNGFYNPGSGGQHGGNGGSGGSDYYCNRDSDCSGNKKCCSRQCRTPAFFG